MLLSALFLGLLGSFHCLGMCGPIAFMLPLDRVNPSKKMLQLSLYHLGRLFSYTLLGFAFGFVGKGLQLFGFQQKLSIVIGIVMILVILMPAHQLSKFNFGRPFYSAVAWVKSKLGTSLKKRTPDTFLTIGLLNGFLPCGLVYMALFGAIAMATPTMGSLYMVVFGFGTIPLMTGAIYFGSFLGTKSKLQIQRLIPVFVVLLGIVFIIRGLGLGIPYLSPIEPTTVELVSSSIECH